MRLSGTGRLSVFRRVCLGLAGVFFGMSVGSMGFWIQDPDRQARYALESLYVYTVEEDGGGGESGRLPLKESEMTESGRSAVLREELPGVLASGDFPSPVERTAIREVKLERIYDAASKEGGLALYRYHVVYDAALDKRDAVATPLVTCEESGEITMRRTGFDWDLEDIRREE